MLPKSHRLPGFLSPQIIKSGRGLFLPELALYYRKSDNPSVKFIIQIPLRVNKRAVLRNRNKRLVSESIRVLMPKLKPNFDCIIKVQKDLSENKQQDIEKLINGLLHKAGILI